MIVVVIGFISWPPNYNMQTARSLEEGNLQDISHRLPLTNIAAPLTFDQRSHNLFSTLDTQSTLDISKIIVNNNSISMNNQSEFSNAIIKDKGSNAVPSPSGNSVYFKVWNDPNENAFSMLLPQSWSANGGTLRNIAGTGDADFQVNATDPTGKEQIIIAYSYKYYVSPLLVGLPEGSVYNPTSAVIYPATPNVFSYRSAADYVKEFIVPELQKNSEGVQILNMTNYPTPSYYYLSGNTQASAVSAILSFTKGGEEYIGGIRLVTAGPGLVWFVDFQAAVAPKDDFQKVSDLASMILPTTRYNLQWAQNEIVQKEARTGIRVDLQKYLENSIDQRFATRESTTDITSQAWSEAMLGTTQAEDPDTGTTYTVPNNFQYWWVDPHGNLVGTTTDTNPNIDQGFKLLKPLSPGQKI